MAIPLATHGPLIVLYVDAPNGRSYLYQFASAPLAGVEFEHRGALLGPWVSERGKLRLQPFAEAMLRQRGGGQSQGLTGQARLLLGAPRFRVRCSWATDALRCRACKRTWNDPL